MAPTFTEKQLKYIMLIPLTLLLISMILYPLIQLVLVSIDSGNIVKHLGRLAKDAEFWGSVKTTLIFVVFSVALEFLLGFVMALLVSDLESTSIRAILLLPMLVAPAAAGLIWRIMFQPMFGIINLILQALHLPPQGWLADPKLALPSVILVDVWQWTAFVYLILLAGLKSIPKDPYEAARIDGASSWQMLRHVTLPLLKPTIYVALLFRSMDAFKALDKFITLTDGGPGQATEVLALHIYKVSFRFLEMGYGALLAIVAVIFVIIFNESFTRAFNLRATR
ncbi:MAG: sugar ABC transporter permease [Firmicutes bacterium]|nr:sugar ABC transporter permease [Bacillota bacterium]